MLFMIIKKCKQLLKTYIDQHLQQYKKKKKKENGQD